MAGTSVLKLKVDDKEYNSSLKQALQGMQHLEQALKDAGKSFKQVDKSVVDYVRGIGQMEAQSKTARGRIGEMSNAFVEFSLQYKKMSEDVKNSDVGKALAASMEELKQRTIDAKNELESLNGELNNVKIPEIKENGLFSGLGDKMSGALQVFAGNMLTKAAGAVASLGSEMYGMVQQGIELAKQGEGIRIAFKRLGRGDILDGLRQATHGTVTDLELMKAAVKFNDFKLPLDQLGTMLAFAQQKAKDTGQSVDYMVESITNGLGRQSKPILDNLGISAKEIEQRMKSTGDFTKAVGEIIRDQMSKVGDYVETAADRATQADVKLKNAMEDLGRTFQPLTDASNGLWNSIKVGALNALNTAVKPLIQALAEAGTLGQGARSSAGFNNLGGNSKVDRMIGRLGNGKSAGAYSIYQQQLGEFDKYINNKQFQIAAFGGDNSSVAQSAKAKLQTELDGALKMREEYVKRAQELHNKVPSPYEQPTTSSTTNSKGGSGKIMRGGTKSEQTEMQTLQASIKELEMEYIKLGGITSDAATKRRAEINQEISANEKRIAQIRLLTEQSHGRLLGGESAQTTGLGHVVELPQVGNGLSQETIDYIKNLKDGGKDVSNSWKTAASSISMVGSAMSGLKNPAIDIMTVIGQSIASIALAYSQNLANDKTTTGNIWAFIAAAAAATISMATTIASLHSITGYANGGMIEGNSFSGDNVYAGNAWVNSGELILNKAQQNSVASQLEGNGIGNLNLRGVLSGENIVIVADRFLQRSGKGELAVWKK